MGDFRPAPGEVVLAKFGGKPKKERGEEAEWRKAPESGGRAEEGHTDHQSKRSELRESSDQSLRGSTGPGKMGKEARVARPSSHTRSHVSPAQPEEKDT